ncbi:hypothetical protein DOTSEDRAFT_25381 [Dothistroma septosporum NZE10]|uniref:Uncharacterized protein n=1 Tax=Dothistroma septosporum (strain NZE10 / CBS 128990) TaxID=675120 RepID=M2Y5C9_DOTSN|nr:hypothetical protein DOTSEDRAFT_25381 [Dothistroma septosporum NZE10]
MGLSASKVAGQSQPPTVDPPQARKSYFLALPPELRVKVYMDLLSSVETVSHRQHPGGNVLDIEIKEPRIMTVCKLLRQEAGPIFYANLKLVIDRSNLFEPSRDTMRSLDLISENQLQRIRHIEIPFGGKMTISIHFTNSTKQSTAPATLYSATAQGAGFHVHTTSSISLCTSVLCAAMSDFVRDFLLCLIVHRARVNIAGSIGPCRSRATRMKPSAVEIKIKGNGLEYLKRDEIGSLLSHLRFNGRHLLREAGVLYL